MKIGPLLKYANLNRVKCYFENIEFHDVIDLLRTSIIILFLPLTFNHYFVDLYTFPISFEITDLPDLFNERRTFSKVWGFTVN